MMSRAEDTMSMHATTTIALASVLWLLAVAPSAAHAAGTPSQKCAQAKLKAAGKSVKGQMSCHAKAKSAGFPVDSSCLAKTETKCAAAVNKAGTACPGTSAEIETAVDTCVAGLLAEAPGDGKCPADSTKAAGKAGRGLLGCRAKEVTKPGTFGACDSKVDGKLASAIAKAGNCADGSGLHTGIHFCHDSIDGIVEPPPTTTTTSSTTTSSTTTSTTLPACSAGARAGGDCWFFGSLGQSCANLCFVNGLSYDPATTAYAGSSGTNAHCNQVLDALGADPGNLPFVATSCGVSNECILAVGGSDTQRARCLDTPANEMASWPSHHRACACTGVLAIAAGGAHTCAAFTDDSIRCWGWGAYGQLGYGNTNDVGDDETPASVGDFSLGAGVGQLVAGSLHTCALLNSGAVRCWGAPSYGQLGYANTDHIGDDESPASVGNVNVGGFVIQLAAGNDHTCALLSTGAVRCWGDANYGQLGYAGTDNIGDDEAPASAGDVNVGGPAIEITAGGLHTCALLSTGAVRCWGSNHAGQLGYGNTNTIGDDETPASAGNVNVGGLVVQISAGASHTCAVLDTGAVRCWGEGFDGRLGYSNVSNIGDNETPASAGDVNVGVTISRVEAGLQHTCATTGSGAVRCWGSGSLGRLGYGNMDHIGDDEVPASAGHVPLGGSAVRLSAGLSHTCALIDVWPGTTLRCWGGNTFGQLGYGNTANVGDDEAAGAAGNVPIL
jgi:alpha-tubulin suppressor-like RCC1 family protein